MESQNAIYETPKSELEVGSEETTIASRKIRLLAYIIDFLIITPIVVAYQWLFGNLEQALNGVQPSMQDNIIGFFLFFLLFVVFNSFLLHTRGQTVGKLLTKTRIQYIDGSDPNFFKFLIFRYLPQWIVAYLPIIGGLIVIDYLFIFGKHRKCIHDYLAKTKVVKIKS